MAKFKVIGAYVVGGVAPGGIVDLDLDEAQLAALFAGGHIEELPAPVAKKSEPDKGGD